MRSTFSFIGLLVWLLCIGCNDFLKEYSQDEVRPVELSDLEQILLGNGYLDADSKEILYGIMDVFTDDIQCGGIREAFRSDFEKMRYRFLWADNMFAASGGGNDESFWELPYKKILGCNIVLDCLDDMRGEESLRENLRGEALVLRAWYYLMLVNMYGMPYNEDGGKSLGVPLKLSMEVKDERMPRNTVAEVYASIEEDLLKGNELLTRYKYSRSVYRINHLAAKALLSRMYLYMEDWDKALDYADSVLVEKPALLDFNKGNWGVVSTYPRSYVYNPDNADEVIWMREGWMVRPDIETGPYMFYASDKLLSLYGTCETSDVREKTLKDIRATVYFNWQMDWNTWKYKRGFLSIGGVYNEVLQGIRTAEMYLNRIEVNAREFMKTGDAEFRRKALVDLNYLRKHRFNSAYPYEDVDIEDAQLLFDFYKEERRRELAGDGQHRWCDLRRYGMPEIEHVLFEKEDGEKIRATLLKNRYVLPIPEEAIRVNPLLKQNN